MVRLFRCRYDVTVGKGVLARGSVVREGRFNPTTQETLVSRKILTPVSTPPLSLVPGWLTRGRRLEGREVTTVEGVLDLDPEELGAFFGVNAEVGAKWQRSLEESFATPDPASRG